MNTVFLIISSVIFFLAFTFARKINDVFFLIAVAIAALVNGNIFNSIDMPISLGNIKLGIDSVLITLFFYTIMVRTIDYSVSDSKKMTVTSIMAVIISALFEWAKDISLAGAITKSNFLHFIMYLICSLATFASVWIVLAVINKLKTKNINPLLLLIIGITIASVIHSIIYYSGYMLLNQTIIANFGMILLGAYITKGFCLILSLICYSINQKWVKPNYE